MLDELKMLLAHADGPGIRKADYFRAVIDDNCLGKRSGKTRVLTWRHLVDLYSLDPDLLLFRALRFFWDRDHAGRPLLALLCALGRDPVLRASVPFIMSHPQGSVVTREAMEECIEKVAPDRFSQATLRSAAQNINSTWTKTGHLLGKTKKNRARAVPTAGSTAYALLLGYLSGIRGKSLFRTDYAAVLESSIDMMIALAEDASRQGWIVTKRIGDVMEILFPTLINQQEMEWIREQG
jgi:hypothetical protein